MKFKDFIEFIKLPPNILTAISLVSGIIILSPDKLIKKLYMISFRNNYGFVISLIFLVCMSILIVLFLTMPISGQTRVTQYAERLHRQDSNKKEILIYDYIDDNFSKTRNMFLKRKKHTRNWVMK